MFLGEEKSAVYILHMDKVSPEKLSWTMAQVKGRDTRPERVVRSILHAQGFRFRLQYGGLPGKPDVVLPKYRAAIFVHGCFWHRHEGCKRATTPSSNIEYWSVKFRRTIERDARNFASLKEMGWRVVVVWECELRDLASLADCLVSQIKGHGDR